MDFKYFQKENPSTDFANYLILVLILNKSKP